MKITKDKAIVDIQKEFKSQFPHLKIEFYLHRHDPGEGSQRRDQIATSVTIGEINPDLSEGTINLTPDTTVADLENIFYQNFGLNIQVFRRSGMLWLQTSATDSWTLSTQEAKGGHSEKIYKG